MERVFRTNGRFAVKSDADALREEIAEQEIVLAPLRAAYAARLAAQHVEEEDPIQAALARRDARSRDAWKKGHNEASATHTLTGDDDPVAAAQARHASRSANAWRRAS